MKSVLSRATGWREAGALLSLLVLGLWLVPCALEAQTQSTFLNTGNITWIGAGASANTVPYPPNIDATNFVNKGFMELLAYPPPFMTAHTLNFTNYGQMIGEVGWEFDYGPLPTGGRGMAASFYNGNYNSSTGNGLIEVYSGSLPNPIMSPFSFPVGYLWVSATNIVNKGVLTADAASEIRLTGTNVNLARSFVEIGGVLSSGSYNNVPTNGQFEPDVAIYDLYWGQTNAGGIDSSAIWDGAAAGSPGFGVTALEAGNVAYCPPRGVFTSIGPFAPAVSDCTNYPTGGLMLTVTNIVGTNNTPVVTNVVVNTNIIRQAAFVSLSDPNIGAAIGFARSPIPTNYFKVVNVELASVSGDTLFVSDVLAADTGRGLLQNSVTEPSLFCNTATYRPTNYIVSRAQVAAFGSPGAGVPTNNFLFDPNWSNNPVAVEYAAYSCLVDDQASEPPANYGDPNTPSFSAVTNLPGRIRISAGSLNLNGTQIRGQGEVVIQATHLVSSENTGVDCENLSYDLGSTNGRLNVVNLAATSVSRFKGTVSLWSALWTNYAGVITTNYEQAVTTDTNGVSSTNWVYSPLTNTVQINLYAWLVDASQLGAAVPVTVYDFALHSTNMVISDSLNVVESFLLDGTGFTLDGTLNFPGTAPTDPVSLVPFAAYPIQNWVYTMAPALRYFTNNGSLSVPSDAHFGDDGPANYLVFCNSGVITAGAQAIDSDFLFITNGLNQSLVGDFTAVARTALLINAQIYTVGDINISAVTDRVDFSTLSAGAALNFDVVSNFSDSGPGANNIFTCNNGFNLWTKPATGDLWGTTISSYGWYEDEVDHFWAGEDRGPYGQGFTNNVALGTLVLTPEQPGPLLPPLFYFAGTGAQNGLYVGTLDLSQFTSLAMLTNGIEIESNLKIYVSQVILGFTPPGGQTPEDFLQAQFPGRLFRMPSLAVSQRGTVDWNTVYQRIDGFGASSAWESYMTTSQADLLFSTNNGIVYTDYLGNTSTNNGVGLSLLRSRIAPGGTSVETSIMQMAQARGASVWSSPWSPAGNFKRTNDIYDADYASDPNHLNGGSILPTTTNYQAYARQLASYVVSMKNTYGVNLYAISVQNEPDAHVNSYEACQWNAQQIHDFVLYLHNALVASNVASTKIMLPESQNWTDPLGLAAGVMSDPVMTNDVGIIANHNYVPDNSVGDQTVPATIPSYGKALWETEVAKLSGSDSSIRDAVYWGTRIYLFLTQAQANAYHYWWLIAYGSGNQGLLDDNASLTKRLFVFGQYSRFVRPGYYRIGVNTSGSSLLLSAYKDTNSLNFAIVAVNPNSSIDFNATFNLTNFPAAGAVIPWITSSTYSLASLPPVTVSNSSFTYLIPAQSVVTFVGQAGNTSNVRPSLLPVANQAINAGVTLLVTNLATDADVPPQVLAFSLLSGPTNATLGAGSGIFAWRPLVTQADTTNLVTVKVADNGVPSLSVTNSFVVKVNPLAQASFGSIALAGGQINLGVNGPAGPNYTLWTSTNLVSWQALYTTNSPPMPLTLVVTNRGDRMRFYRLQLGP